MFASFAVTLALATAAIAAPIAPNVLASVTAALVLPNTTQTDNATWYLQNGNAGACGLYSQDTDLVVGLPLEFYNATDSVSPYCGSYVVVENVLNNVTVTARIEDASATSGILSLSVATFRALDGDATNLNTVTWRFANATEIAAAKASIASSVLVSATSVTSTYVAPAEVETTSTYVAPAAVVTTTTTTSEYVAPATTQESVYVAPATTKETYVAPVTTTTKEVYVAPVTTTTTTEYVAPATTVKAATSSGSFSGQATYFYQGGVAGACGTVHSDSDYIVALDSAIYNGGSHCGSQVTITGNGKTITATVADECPTCASSYSLDLSVAAFTALASESAGVVSISWSWA